MFVINVLYVYFNFSVFSKKIKNFIFIGLERMVGKIDVKEGIYFGLDVSFDDLDVIFGIFMVGLN